MDQHKARKTAELSKNLHKALREALYDLIEDPDLESDVVVSATVSSCIDLALKVALASGLGPGDFINSVNLLIGFIEQKYGTECKGTIAMEVKTAAEVTEELKAGLN